jgi:formate transporter
MLHLSHFYPSLPTYPLFGHRMGIALGAKVTFSQFLLANLVPVTLGNTLAGVLCTATLLGFVHGSLGKDK